MCEIRTERSDRAAVADDSPAGPPLLTVGHGTASADGFARLLCGAGVRLVVAVRSAPGSRRFPQFGRAALVDRLPARGIGYRWEPGLGGFREPRLDSPNVLLRHPSFRAYADYMATEEFRAALADVVGEASRQLTAIMCAETLWWRCHRRLVADAAVILCGAEVRHLGHDGRLSAHQLTEGVRCAAPGVLVYDAA